MPNTITRRHVLRAGAAAAAAAGLAAPRVSAQGAKTPTKVLDFLTYADVAKAEAEGQFVFYCHENEAGTAAIVEGFGKDFPKIAEIQLSTSPDGRSILADVFTAEASNPAPVPR